MEAEEGEPPEDRAPLTGPIPLALSAKAEPALREAAGRLASHIQENPELDPTDLAYSLLTTRSSFEHRAVALGTDREQLLDALGSLARGEESPDALSATARPGKPAYLLSGQGAQRPGMGRELYESDPIFAKALDEAFEHLDPHLEKPLREVLFKTTKGAAKALQHTSYAQPALFAIEVALAEALGQRGLSPRLLAGHSIGELAAAHISGVLSLPEAAELIAARGRLMGELPKGGAMAAIAITEQEAGESIEGREREVSIAAINGPSSTVISGAEGAVEEIRSSWEAQGKRTKRLAVSHAFHSPLMEPMLEEFAKVAGRLTYQEPQIPILSGPSGEVLDPSQATDPAYWVSQAREPVRFARAVETLQEQGAGALSSSAPTRS